MTYEENLFYFLSVYDGGLALGKWGVPVVWSVDLLQVRVMLNINRMLRLHMVEDTTSLLPPDILRDSHHPAAMRKFMI
jgi:hypothetical protein